MNQTAQNNSNSPAGGLITRPFLVAVALLGAAVVLAGPVADWLDIQREKLPLPLRAPLGSLSESALAPYRVVKRHIIDPAIVKVLGTNQYLSWTLEDTEVTETDPLRYVELLVSYDSGGHNLVPHTPDVCRLGAGYQPAQPHENTQVNLTRLPGTRDVVPVRLCTFGKTDVFQREQVSVVYTFFCNGEFRETRNGVRILINDLTNVYSFFSKVEISFPRATRTQCLDGAAKLMDRVLPALLSNHWPDFNKAESDARRSTRRDGS
jgi:hypothetical protein